MGRGPACMVVVVLLVAFLTVASGCGSPQPDSSPVSSSPATPATPADVAALAARDGLHPASESTSLSLRLPRDLEASSEWSLKQHVCLQAGYDLEPYAGKPVQVRAYQLTERVGGEPLTLWVVRSGDALVGAYVTDKVSDPGVYAVNEL